MKKRFYIIPAFLFTASLHAQVIVPNLANSGAKGIFVMTGEQVSTVRGPVTGYIIERKSANDKDFKEVAKLPAVGSLADFKKRSIEANTMLPYPVINRIKMDSVWLRVQATPNLARLGTIGYALPVLTGLNMVWLDRNVEAGKTYLYRVSAIGSGYVGLSLPVTWQKHDSIASLHFENGQFNQPQRRMELYWESHGSGKPVYLETYRRADNAKFEKINAKVSVLPVKDTFKFLVNDTTAVKGRLYHYYVKGYDAFGNAGTASDTQSIASLDIIQMPMPEKIKVVGDSVAEAIHISWTLREPQYINMLTLYRSTSSVNGFTPVAVLSPDVHEYIDQDIEPSTSYFYYFEVQFKLQTAARRGTSFGTSYKDYRKPAIPVDIAASTVKGGVQLEWLCEGNDISGFWLYRAESGSAMKLAGKLIKVKKIAGKYSFTDNDSSLNGGKLYRYTLKSYSTSHLESSFSDTVSARPGKEAPAPRSPLHVVARQSGDAIFIKWDNVAGYDENTHEYILLRGRKGKTANMYTIDSVPVISNNYTDTLVTSGETLRYAVLSRSLFGAVSKPSPWVYAQAQSDQPVAPASIMIHNTTSGVQLNWQPGGEGTSFRYTIYRYERGRQPVKAGTTAGGAASFTDQSAIRGKHYYYFICAIGNDNKESERSREAHINF